MSKMPKVKSLRNLIFTRKIIVVYHKDDAGFDVWANENYFEFETALIDYNTVGIRIDMSSGERIDMQAEIGSNYGRDVVFMLERFESLFLQDKAVIDSFIEQVCEIADKRKAMFVVCIKSSELYLLDRISNRIPSIFSSLLNLDDK